MKKMIVSLLTAFCVARSAAGFSRLCSVAGGVQQQTKQPTTTTAAPIVDDSVTCVGLGSLVSPLPPIH